MEMLSLKEIIHVTGAEEISKLQGEEKILRFNAVTTDSRKVTDGVLFVALKG